MYCSLYKKSSFTLGGLQPRWPLVLRSLPHAFFKSMYTLEVIAVLHYNKHDYVVDAYVSKACVSSNQMYSICAIKRLLSTTAMYVSSSSFMYLRFPCYCNACLNSSDLRVGLKTLLNTIQLYPKLQFHKSWKVRDASAMSSSTRPSKI